MNAGSTSVQAPMQNSSSCNAGVSANFLSFGTFNTQLVQNLQVYFNLASASDWQSLDALTVRRNSAAF